MPPCPASTDSPDSSAYAASSSRARLDSLVGTTTSTSTCRSPRTPRREVRHALAAQPDLRRRLGAGLDLDLLVAVDRRDRDPRPERRLGDRHLGLVVELGAVALERRVRLDVDGDVQAARRAAARTDLALVRQPDLVALVDPGRDRHPQRPPALRPALAAARLARRLDDPALAAAARAGADVDHLAEHRLADRADLAAAVALRAGRGLGARLGAAAEARVAAEQDRELDLLLGPLDRLLEGDPQVVAEVRARQRPAAPSAARGRRAAPEERIEDVAEAAERVEPAAPRRRPTPARPNMS